jgi:hypothetical protein
MGFDVTDRLGINPRDGLRLDDDFGLTVDAGCGIADLRCAVVIDSGAFDDRINAIAIVQRVAEPLEDTVATPLPSIKPLGSASKGRQWLSGE